MPGQVFDVETGYHYNYFRDYEPVVGRYIESDPAGLLAGPATFEYVFSNPLGWRDPTGLSPANIALARAGIGCFVGGLGAAAVEAGRQVLPQYYRCCLAQCGSPSNLLECDLAKCRPEIDACPVFIAAAAGCIVGSIKPEYSLLAGPIAAWFISIWRYCEPTRATNAEQRPTAGTRLP
jgi:RHS repeat-associated protein